MAVDISKAGNIKTFPMGAVVVQEGPAAPKEMVIVLQGNVGVYRNYKMNNEAMLGVIGQGSFRGEFGLFLGQDQRETLVALTNVVVMTIGRRNVKDFFTGQPDMAFTIVENICKRLDEADTTLYKLQRGGEKEGASCRKSALFPEGHGNYTLALNNDSEEFIYPTKTTCPLCGYTFDSLGIITSKLRMECTDSDLRVRYKDFEPLYYEILTCPNCFFSASVGSFSEVSKRLANEVNQAVGPYKLEMYVQTGLERDTFTVFAGYYLALLCAPMVFDNHHLITANLWLKISRLYQDCGDDALNRYASEKALQDFRYTYENLRVSEKQVQQICYLIADLHYRMGDLDEARNFFFMAKTNKAGTNVLKRQADIRLEEIREIKKGEQSANSG